MKRDWIDGRLRVAFVSPFPCPFDYGHVVAEPGEDGLERDAVWLGPRKRSLDCVTGFVAAVVRFDDSGVEDDKWVVSPDGFVSARQVATLRWFFRVYAVVKRSFGRGTRFGGVEVRPSAGEGDAEP